MFALFASMVGVSCFAIAGVVRRHIIQLVSNGMKHFLSLQLNGIVAGIYAVYVRRQLIICATLVHIHCAEVAFGSLIMFVLEVIKASALFA